MLSRNIARNARDCKKTRLVENKNDEVRELTLAHSSEIILLLLLGSVLARR